MIDLHDMIDDCAVDLKGVRFIPAVVEKGRVTQKPTETLFAFRGSFQPLSQKELQRLPEGMRNSGRAKLYTTVCLRTVNTSECDLPDRVIHKGITYQVDRVDDWSDYAGYYRIELERMTR